VPVLAGQHVMQAGFGLQSFQFFERAVEGTFDAGVVAGQAVGQRVKHVSLGLEDAHAAEIPRGGDELIEQSELDSALGLDVVLIMREQFFELFAFLRFYG
jgi:hypothetical protein